MMQHRHFVLIAATIANMKRTASDPSDPWTVEQVAAHFATALSATNPRFDRARFIAAAMGAPTTRRDAAK